MPSDGGRTRTGSTTADGGRGREVLDVLEGPVEAFRSAVGRTVDEVRARLTSLAEAGGAERARAGLGPLARGRIDPERFAALFAGAEALDPDDVAAMREALEVLAALDASGDDAFLRRLAAGSDLRGAAGAALSRLGRAFGAARTAELARTGRYDPGRHGGWLEAFPPAMWNPAERRIAPPLVLELRGEDLRPAALADLLDGAQKLALVVEGDAPPAPLVRLVTPGVLVLQTEDPVELDLLAAHEGPGVAAVYPEGSGAAAFLHDPAAGDALSERLAVRELPAAGGLRPVGTLTVFAQAQELEQLAALAEASPAPADPSGNGSGPGPEGEEPADRLAAWLLRQASLPEPDGG